MDSHQSEGEREIDISRLTAERDEARAECERLRKECNDSADRDAELYRLRAVVAALRRGGEP